MTGSIAVVGSGYVGTVVAACFARLGFEVRGLALDPAKLSELRRGRVPFFEAGLDDLLADGIARGRLEFSADPDRAIAGADVVFLCVGTPPLPDGRPDLSWVREAAATMARAVRGPIVLVTKSTVPVGSGHWLTSVIEDAIPPARRQTCPVSVVSNPEFLRQGSAVNDFLHPERVVIGGDDPAALDRVAALYQPVVDQRFPGGNGYRPPLIRTSLATAETIKYAANAFLATKISFANELANICERVGADITGVTTAIGLDGRIGPRFLDAGIGWGGSCFGKDLSALVTTAEEHGYDAPLLRASVAVNARQRTVVVDKLQAHLKTLLGRRIGVLGLAFKPGTDDLRDAPSVDIIGRLVSRGCLVTAHDPVVRHLPSVPGVALVEDPLDVADRADAVLLMTDWPEYLGVDLAALRNRMRGDVLFDGRNLFDPESVRAAGLTYDAIGRFAPRRRVRTPS
jgi:nucleotide sugar dehydrogenase